MDIIGERLRSLRESVKLSQAKLASIGDMTQASLNRYENGQSTPPPKIFLWYADYFDVSLDYIFGRTDQPQGKLYSGQPPVIKPLVASEADLAAMVEMCFDPQSPVNDRMKKALLKVLKEAQP